MSGRWVILFSRFLAVAQKRFRASPHSTFLLKSFLFRRSIPNWHPAAIRRKQAADSVSEYSKAG